VKKFIAAFVFFIAMFFCNCGMQKRLYTKGFYASKQQGVKKHEAQDTVTDIATLLKNIKQLAKANSTTLLAQLGSRNMPLLPQTEKNLFETGGCDTVFLKDGTVRLVHIVSLRPSRINYLPCYSSDSVVSFFLKSDVIAVHRVNRKLETMYAKQLSDIKQFSATSPCDTIFLRDGSVQFVRVVEAERKKIIYFPCGADISSVSVFSRRRVDAIYYGDGRVETEYVNPIKKQARSIWAIIGVCLSVAGIFVSCSLLAMDSTPAFMIGTIIGLVLAGFIFNLIAIIKTKGRGKWSLVGTFEFIFSLAVLVTLIIALVLFATNPFANFYIF
jgi:hypothetical protein